MTHLKHKSKGQLFLMFLIFAPILMALYAYVVMLLWNWLMPAIIGASIITFWQSVGLILLVKLLFGFGGGSGGKKSKDCNYKSRSWKDKMKEKFETMSDEEKLNFRDKWRGTNSDSL